MNTIVFPTFVVDLVSGAFHAIVEVSIQQMEAYGELLSNVAKTVDEFMTDNISDNKACDWMVIGYPQVICLDTSGIGRDEQWYVLNGVGYYSKMEPDF